MNIMTNFNDYYGAFQSRTSIETIVLKNDWTEKIDIVKELNHIPDSWKMTANYNQISNVTTIIIISA